MDYNNNYFNDNVNCLWNFQHCSSNFEIIKDCGIFIILFRASSTPSSSILPTMRRYKLHITMTIISTKAWIACKIFGIVPTTPKLLKTREYLLFSGEQPPPLPILQRKDTNWTTLTIKLCLLSFLQEEPAKIARRFLLLKTYACTSGSTQSPSLSPLKIYRWNLRM